MASAMTCYHNTIAATRFGSLTKAQGLKVSALTESERAETLRFLSIRPIHTVCMASFLRDNGVISPENRGTFYGCRDARGALQGVALIGHATLIETENDEALRAFAYLQHQFANAHLVRGEHEIVSGFWKHYAELGHQPRLACREVLFVQNAASCFTERIPSLRPATFAELDQIKRVNADFILSECGIDPLKRDPEGFTKRLSIRLAKGWVWILEENGTVIFKADVFAQTAQAAYLEGVYVHPDFRRRGIGLRCVRDLSQRLLQTAESVCLLVNQDREGLEHFYTRAGYSVSGIYDTIYLNSEN
jgi:predicted GNAT family acetyltransferase